MQIDLFALLTDGKSSELEFGKSTPQQIGTLIDDDEATSQGSDRTPASWFIYSDDLEFYFFGKSPKFTGVKLKVSYYGPAFGGGRAEQDHMNKLKSGKIDWAFGLSDWEDLETLPKAIRKIGRAVSSYHAGEDKDIFLHLKVAERELSFEYRLEPHQSSNGFYEFEYFLHAIRLNDHRAIELAQTGN